MSELREEIERQFRAHGLLDDAKADGTPSECASAEGNEDMSTPPPEEKVVIAVIPSPACYSEKFASDFNNLPHEWQVFLSEHEENNAAKLQEYADKLAAFQELEELFGHSKERLLRQGIEKVQDWLKGLVWIDDAMASNPIATIMAIAKVYGVNDCLFPQSASRDALLTAARLCNLERYCHDVSAYLHTDKQQRMADLLQMFSRQTDTAGNLLHPYFEKVKSEICSMLDCGLAESVDEAYEKALWIHPSVRAELIAKEFDSKAAEADKAKKAAFAPRGKSETPKRALTLREEIEKNMAALMG